MKTHEKKMAQHDKLAREHRICLFDRVTLLTEIYEDPEFRKDMQAKGISFIQVLDEKVADTCATILQLMEIRKKFPRKLQWAAGNLNQMLRETFKDLEKEYNKKKKPRGKRHRASVAQLEELKQENKMLKQRLADVMSELELARKTIDILNRGGGGSRQAGK